MSGKPLVSERISGDVHGVRLDMSGHVWCRGSRIPHYAATTYCLTPTLVGVNAVSPNVAGAHDVGATSVTPAVVGTRDVATRHARCLGSHM